MDLDRVSVLRFLNDDVMAEIVFETKDTITLKNPVRIVVIPNPTNQKPTVGFVPFMEWTTENEFEMSKAFLLCRAKPLPAFLDKYGEQFSGLILPEKSSIIAAH